MTAQLTPSHSAHHVAVIGGGFSGLTLAWALNKLNVSVDIFEKTDRAGGLLQTSTQPLFAESAANALLASEAVEDLFRDVGLKPLKAGHKSKRRLIFRSQSLTWPLTGFETVSAVWSFLKNYLRSEHRPRPQESLKSWAERVFGSEAVSHYLFSPAFRGVYAVTADKLSAELVTASLFQSFLRSKRGKLKGSLSSLNGMGGLMKSLTEHLQQNGVNFHYGVQPAILDLQAQFPAVVIATPVHAAAQLLKPLDADLSVKMSDISTEPVTSVNLVYNKSRALRGFGCLFPSVENFHAMGVLFNSDIFEGRGDAENETWIFAGASHEQADILDKIRSDRERLIGSNEVPSSFQINRWPQGLPIYNNRLKEWLESFDVNKTRPSALTVLRNGLRLPFESPVYMTGNYLGAIGLAKILDYNLRLAERIRRELP